MKRLFASISTLLIKLGYWMRSDGFHHDIFCCPKEHVGQAIIKNGIYDRSSINLIVNLMKAVRGKTVYIDVGANIGNHSCMISKHAHEALFFEPNPILAKILEANLELNKINNGFLHRVALGSESQDAYLSMPAQNFGEGKIIKKLAEDKNSFAVQVTSLDKVLMEKNYTDKELFIKIDVEGYEMEVLKGSLQTLSNNFCHLFVEHSGDTKSNAVAQFLNELGYVIDSKQSGKAARLSKIKSQSQRLDVLMEAQSFYHCIYWSKLENVR